jgi:hypothetical protein
MLFNDRKLQGWGLSANLIVRKMTPRLPLLAGQVARQVLVSYGQEKHPGSHMFGIKRGGWNAFNLSTIRRLLPDVYCLHIVRDGRGVYASEKKAIHRTGRPFQDDVRAAAWRWRQTVRSFSQAEESGLEVRYEDLLRNPRTILSNILAFLNLESTDGIIEEMLQTHASTYVASDRRLNHPNVGKPPLLERINAWRQDLTPKEIRTFEMIAGDTLKKKDYELCYPKGAWDGVYRAFTTVRQRVERRLR